MDEINDIFNSFQNPSSPKDTDNPTHGSNSNSDSFYDTSTLRNSKRLEQMKRKKELLTSSNDIEECDSSNENSPPEEIIHTRISANPILFPRKKYQNDLEDKVDEEQELMEKDSIGDTNPDNNIEVIISDLECDLDDNESDNEEKKNQSDNNNMFNKNATLIAITKATRSQNSFIKINNKLKTSLEKDSDKKTNSYLMALGNEDSKQNYEVDSIIEEEDDIEVHNEENEQKKNVFTKIVSHKTSKSEMINITNTIEKIKEKIDKENEINQMKKKEIKQNLIDIFTSGFGGEEYEEENENEIDDNEQHEVHISQNSIFETDNNLHTEEQNFNNDNNYHYPHISDKSDNSSKLKGKTSNLSSGINVNLNSFNSSNSININQINFYKNYPVNDRRMKALSYEISTPVKINILTEKNKSTSINSLAKLPTKNHKLNSFPYSGTISSKKNQKCHMHNKSHQCSLLIHDIRKKLLLNKGKAQSLYLKKTAISEENIAPQIYQKKTTINKRIKHQLTFNNKAQNDTAMISACYHTMPNSKSIDLEGNKRLMMEAIKAMKFQFSSLDHQRFALEKINKSSSASFIAMVTNDFTFKSLYEINFKKNMLFKVYSTHRTFDTIGYKDSMTLFKFDMTNKTFSISNAKGFTSSTVAFCMNNASNNNLSHTGKMYKKNYNNLYICK